MKSRFLESGFLISLNGVELFKKLELLDIKGNEVSDLKENLPSSLKILDFSWNKVFDWPQFLPEELQKINGSNNCFVDWLRVLGRKLESIFLENNHLISIPEELPRGLNKLALGNNQIASIPQSIFRLPSECTVYLENNPLSERVLRNAQQVAQAAGYRGPIIQFNMAYGIDTTPARPLKDALASWGVVDQIPAEVSASQAVPLDDATEAAVSQAAAGAASQGQQMPTAAAAEPLEHQGFSKFLDRLRHTVNYRNEATRPVFQEKVSEWLTHLLAHPDLLALSMAVAQGATASCEDRVTYTYRDLKNLRVSDDIEKNPNAYSVPELMSQARKFFRETQLDQIAREKVKALPMVDEMEVHLGYPVQLDQALDLQLDTREMAFFRCSGVTDRDLADATARVQKAETESFGSFLVQWGPWETWIKKRDPAGHKKVVDAAAALVETQFNGRLDARMAAEWEKILVEASAQASTSVPLSPPSDADRLAFMANPDWRRNCGIAVGNDIQAEAKLPLTQKWLALEGQSHLLQSPWVAAAA